MAQFESWQQFREFSEFVMRRSRYIFDDRQRAFLETVVETSHSRKRIIETGTEYWRAQIAHETRFDEEEGFECEVPCRVERMKPLRDRATEGRVNPKGIPCLYLSDHRETAMAETRPWIGSVLTVAQLVTLRPLVVVDCSTELMAGRRIWFSSTEPAAEKREKFVWGHMNIAFAQPVTRNDDVAEYAPTQVIAEAFRHAGYDGIVYASKLGGGKNVALFDVEDAEVATRRLCRVATLKFEFSGGANPCIEPKYRRESESNTVDME